MRKILLTIASTITLSTPSTISFFNTSNSNYIQSNYIQSNYLEINIKSPVGEKSFLTTGGDWNTIQTKWAYTTINLGKMKQEQIMGISSLYNDSYTEHKVDSYNYYYTDFSAGIHHGPNFRNFFFNDKVTSNWDYNDAIKNAALNFNSRTTSGSAKHWAWGKIKFLWHYNENSDLLIDIVGTLLVGAYSSTVEGIASINLGSYFTIYYTN